MLYCWEDLADLIEENRSVFNWYINGQQFKETHKVWVGFDNDNEEFLVNMPIVKTITRYKYVEPDLQNHFDNLKKFSMFESVTSSIVNPFTLPDKINRSWCKVKIFIQNRGEKVIEDWKLYLHIEEGKYKLIDDDTPKSNIYPYIPLIQNRTSWVFKDEGYFAYLPINNGPLIQKDGKSFEIFILPNLDVNEIKLKWELLSRDYSDESEIIIKINHEVTDKINVIEVNNIEDVLDEETEFEYFYEKVERNEDDFMMPNIGSKSRKKK